MSFIAREPCNQTATIVAGAALSDAIKYDYYAEGGFYVPSGVDNSAKFAFKVSDKLAGTYYPLYDEANALVEVTVHAGIARAYPLPIELQGFPYFKLWTEVSGVNAVQGGTKAFVVSLKA
jgi:hypothetical protein